MASVRFGVFELDVAAGLLKKAGVRLRVPDQSLEILTLLLNREGEVVTREEIRARLWPDGTIVDFDHSMNSAVNRLREALMDSAAAPRFIETLPKRGYRFIGEVERAPDVATAPAPSNHPPPLAVSRPAPKRGRRAWPFLVPAVAVAGLVLIVFYLRRPASVDLSKLKLTPFSMEAETEVLGYWSPDGKRVAYVKADGFQRHLMVRSVNASAPTQLTQTPYHLVESPPFFSLDSERIYFIARVDPFAGHAGARPGLWSIAAVGGEPRRVLEAEVWAAALSPDGNSLALWQSYEEAGRQYGGVSISSPPGAEPRKYEPAPFRVEGLYGPNYIRFSADGSQIAFSGYRIPGEALFWILPWPNGPDKRPRRAFPGRLFRAPPAFDWMPDSRQVVLSDNSLWLGDTRTGELQRLTSKATDYALHPSVLPDGVRVLYTAASFDFHIIELPLDGSQPKTVQPTTRWDYSPSWSAAGDKMAFVTDRSGETEIWLRDRNSGEEHAVVRQADFPDDPGQSFQNVALSPDGTRFSYLRHGRLWISQATGGGASPAVFGGGQMFTAASWSPDSSSIAYQTLDGGRRQVAVTRIGSQQAQFLVPDTASLCSTAPIWSPDGRWLACHGAGEAALLLAPDGKRRRSLPSPVRGAVQGMVLAWSQDGATLYLASSLTPATARLDAWDVRTGKLRKIAKYKEALYFEASTSYSLFGSVNPRAKILATTICFE